MYIFLMSHGVRTSMYLFEGSGSIHTRVKSYPHLANSAVVPGCMDVGTKAFNMARAEEP